MRINKEAARTLGTLAMASGLLAVAVPAPLTAQEEPPEPTQQQEQQPSSTVDEAEMEAYVRLELAIDRLQEAAIQEMAAIHSENGRATIRNNLTESINAAHEEHGVDAGRYETITFLLSTDAEVRELYETTRARIVEEGGGETGG